MTSEDEFVRALTRDLPPMPADMATTLRANQGRA
jgi:hypothetical protein